MSRLRILSGSPDEVGALLQENYDRMLDSSRKWAELLKLFTP